MQAIELLTLPIAKYLSYTPPILLPCFFTSFPSTMPPYVAVHHASIWLNAVHPQLNDVHQASV